MKIKNLNCTLYGLVFLSSCLLIWLILLEHTKPIYTVSLLDEKYKYPYELYMMEIFDTPYIVDHQMIYDMNGNLVLSNFHYNEGAIFINSIQSYIYLNNEQINYSDFFINMHLRENSIKRVQGASYRLSDKELILTFSAGNTNSTKYIYAKLNSNGLFDSVSIELTGKEIIGVIQDRLLVYSEKKMQIYEFSNPKSIQLIASLDKVPCFMPDDLWEPLLSYKEINSYLFGITSLGKGTCVFSHENGENIRMVAYIDYPSFIFRVWQDGIILSNKVHYRYYSLEDITNKLSFKESSTFVCMHIYACTNIIDDVVIDYTNNLLYEIRKDDILRIYDIYQLFRYNR